MSFTCNFCKQSVKSKYNLKSHIEKNKTCLKNRGIVFTSNFICEGCNLTFTNKANLKIHQKTAKYCVKIQETKQKEHFVLRKSV